MRCPSCGTVHRSKRCPQSAKLAAAALALSSPEVELDQNVDANSEMENSDSEAMAGSRLIEFPGVARRSVPKWRKELTERVREVQERRAREAAEEAERPGKQQPATSPPQLELLHQAEASSMNPVVAAALRRIERAYESPSSGGHSAAATAVAIACEDEAEDNQAIAVATASAEESTPPSQPAPATERTHNLVVVPASVALESEPSEEKSKPKRLIADDLNDPALSYLDSIGVSSKPLAIGGLASLSSRLAAAVIDLVAVGFLSLPVASVIELQDGNWHQPKTVGLLVGISATVMFVYSTVTTALTGQTFGMRLVSLRAVDVRTGSIPSGKQSAGRALIYLLSLATMGIGLLLAFGRGEGKTAHDRLSRTAVVQD